MTTTRRSLLKAIAAGGSAVASSLCGKQQAAAGEEAHEAGKHSWGMAIDLDLCTACGACTVACREENNVVNVDVTEQGEAREIEWNSMLWRDSFEEGGLPEMLPFMCQHCRNPPCVKVCPVGATYRDPEGIVGQIYERCIGCRFCTVACPYTRRSFNWSEPNWNGSLVQLLNPDVATRPMGVVEKCTFCSHRVQDVKERAALAGRSPTDAETRRLTACAAACPAEAISFGDLNDPESTVSRQAQGSRTFQLLEDLGTEPRVYYLKRDRRP